MGVSSLSSGSTPIIFSPATLPLTVVSSSPPTPLPAHAAPPLPEPVSNITSAASLESASPMPSPMAPVSPSPLQFVLTTHPMVTRGKPVSTLALSSKRLSLHDSDPLPDVTEYRSVVGALQYLTITRPDISFAINQVCQFVHQPTTIHWISVKRILHYLKATYFHGLFYKPSSLCLTTYSDTDYAVDPDDRRSTGGYCIYLASNLVSWSSKNQKGVSHSSTEAKYRQLAQTTATLSWFRSLLRDLQLPLACPQLWCDNVSTISLASNPVFHSRTRYVEVDFHYVPKKVVRRELQVAYVPTHDQLADVFTKGLSTTRFLYIVSKLPMQHCPVSLRGCNESRTSSNLDLESPNVTT
ncbi:unnamed protein product [Prunus armeniaca]